YAIATLLGCLHTQGQIRPDGTNNVIESHSLVSFDFPGAQSTVAWGVNNSGQITGYYNGAKGFLLDKANFLRIQLPHSGLTQALGINSSGTIVGDYSGASGQEGFKFDGHFHHINVGSS